jgi:hypothetical protein
MSIVIKSVAFHWTAWFAIVACSPPFDGTRPANDENLTPPPRNEKGDAGAKDGGTATPPSASDAGAKRGPQNPDGKDMAEGMAGWLFNGYCGNETVGACADVPDCADDADTITSTSCPRTLDLCLGAANESSIRKTYLCTEKAAEAWVFNGYCDSDPTTPCPSGGKPACADKAPAGKECDESQVKCVSGSSIFVCIKGEKSVWVTSGHCGVSSAGEKSCADGERPVCKDNYGGKSCDPENETHCQTTSNGSEPGKVFSCVSR